MPNRGRGGGGGAGRGPKRPQQRRGGKGRRQGDDWLTRAHRRARPLLERARTLQGRVPRLIAFLRIVYYPVALALVAYFGYSAAKKIDFSQVRYLPLAFSYVFALIWWTGMALGWSALITGRYEFGPLGNWCRTQVARYVPGGFWAPVARATTVQGRVRHKATAVIAENVTLLFVALGVGALWASIHRPEFAPLILVGFVPLLLSRWLERHSQIDRVQLMRASVTYAVAFAAYGFAGVLSQVAFTGVRLHHTYPLYVAGASCVAWAVGLVVVFAPGGVGVRELVYVWMLSDLSYTSADLKGAAVANRLVCIAAELTVLLYVMVRPRIRRRLGVAGETTGGDSGDGGGSGEGKATTPAGSRIS